MPHSQSSEPGFESYFAIVSKIEHFRSLHWRPSWVSCINKYLAIDSGGNVSDLVVARICCMARMLPGEAELVSEWTGLPGRAKSVCTALWAVRRTGYYIKNYLYLFYNFIRLSYYIATLAIRCITKLIVVHLKNENPCVKLWHACSIGGHVWFCRHW